MKANRFRMAAVLAGLALPVLAARLEVTADRVNLRAKPRAEAEVAGQVNRGAVLESRGESGEWIGVAAPTNLGLWVSAEFIRNDRVATDRLNVRAGPGIAYPAVALLTANEPVTPRSQTGEWMEIAPPTNAVLWVHTNYVRVIEAEPVGPPVEAAPVRVEPAPPRGAPPEPAVVTPPEPLAVAPPPIPTAPPLVSATRPPPPVPPVLTDRELAPLEEKMETMTREGSLHRTSIFDRNRVSDYCLMDWERGRPVTVCYLQGNSRQLKELDGRRLRVKGDGYWVEGTPKPVITPREITPL